ncbi:LacI family DNA-binding transcriptional regulator [Streptomyces purpurogeneiscleroticus]|uniref:LacI family DNA-binding transcriptional regulator n=1 Tax=Streptomyces purpurogeneiscleroticus TaxID=68259 RepID=UPI001CBDA922|nr:LacI family DNA-binding transcriptional regulator [Streptomyces purpurogeneiscleroticus]MBZ4017981.1 LacI family transcriptional regulator [Streptomyces purpurogeneiscleroticus]
MANIKDVAERAGVSVATVSRVLNGLSPVAATRDRVLAAVAELGYRPNNVARALRTARTGALGLLIGDLTNPFFTELADAVEVEARSLGYSLVIGNAGESPQQQDDHIRTLIDRRIDGLLVSSAGTGSPVLREVAAAGTPLVLLDRAVDGLDVPCVRADGRAALADLAAHFAALGRRRPAIIVAPAGTRTGADRLRFFREALRPYGIELPDERVGATPDLQHTGGRRVMRGFLDLPEPPDAVLATDNLMALGAMDEIRARGLRVPDDVALVVYDDVPWFRHTDPPLTAIAQPTRELGRAAVHTLLERIEGRPAESVLLPARLVPRHSCGEPAPAHEARAPEPVDAPRAPVPADERHEPVPEHAPHAPQPADDPRTTDDSDTDTDSHSHSHSHSDTDTHNERGSA